MAHRLQIDDVPIMRMSNHEGLIDLGAKGIPLELAHPRCDLDGMGRERTGPLQLHHLKVIADHSVGGTQDTKLVALRLKIPPRLGEVHGQPGRDALSLQLLGHRISELSLEGANLLLRVIALLAGLVTILEGLIALLDSRAMLRAEPLRGLEQLIPLLA